MQTIPTRVRPAFGTPPSTVRPGRQAPTLKPGPNHDPRRGFCNTRCDLCEADMSDSIRRNNALSRRAR